VNISFIVNHIYINGGWSPWDARVGGSEECVIEWSKRLAKTHKVQVFHNGRHGEYKGVRYRPHDEYEPGDVTVNVNYPEFTPKGKTVYFSTLISNPDTSKFDIVACLSEYARDNTNLPNRSVILPPGYDPDKVFPDGKIAKQCFYASSPDRGLDTLLEAWPSVMAAHPDATLLLTYGAKIEMPGVICMGEVDEDTMNAVYNTSDIWCHPCNGGELYCMTGKKAQAAACIPVIIPTMALDETVTRGYKVNDPDKYGEMLSEVLNMPMELRNHIREDVKAHAITPTWEESTDRLLKIIENAIV